MCGSSSPSGFLPFPASSMWYPNEMQRGSTKQVLSGEADTANHPIKAPWISYLLFNLLLPPVGCSARTLRQWSCCRPAPATNPTARTAPSAWWLLGSPSAAACPVSTAANVTRWPPFTSWVETDLWSCRARSSDPQRTFHYRYGQTQKLFLLSLNKGLKPCHVTCVDPWKCRSRILLRYMEKTFSGRLKRRREPPKSSL